MLTEAKLLQALRGCKNPDLWCGPLNAAFAKYAINTPPRAASFLAQVGYESGKRFPTEAVAQPYVAKPEKLANLGYANRLGNGAPESGDGGCYRGPGLIQLKGRSNYAAAAKASGIAAVDNPDLLMQPAAAMSAA